MPHTHLSSLKLNFLSKSKLVCKHSSWLALTSSLFKIHFLYFIHFDYPNSAIGSIIWGTLHERALKTLILIMCISQPCCNIVILLMHNVIIKISD